MLDNPAPAVASSSPGVAKLSAAPIQPMMDDQKTIIHVVPLNANGKPTALPTGGMISYAVDNAALVSLAPGIDPTTLSCQVSGVKGQAGTAIVTASFKNADGSIATGSIEFDITLDPAELDVASLGVTVDPPIAQ